MASIKKDYNSMGLPMNINRSNPIPVDCTELWYSLEEAQNYARNDPRAYVGQSVKVVDETSNATTVYVIKDAAGNLMQLADIDSAGSGSGDCSRETTPEDIIEWMSEEHIIIPLASSSGEVYLTNDNKIIII